MTVTTTSKRPVILITGPTGIGKTKLAIAIAKALNTEIVSVDSLQVYRDGGLMTAKATPKEMEGVTHHMIDYLDADQEPDEYLSMALQAIQDIHSRRMVPVLCGGSTSLTIPLLFDAFGPRYRTLVIQLFASEAMLDPRLDARIDEMLSEGLLDELRGLHMLEKELIGVLDFSRGVWKAIGYPEFHPYLESDGQESSLFAAGVVKMKENTRLYARYQCQWFDSCLMPLLDAHGVQHKSIEVVPKGDWERDVMAPVAGLCTSWSRAKIGKWRQTTQ